MPVRQPGRLSMEADMSEPRRLTLVVSVAVILAVVVWAVVLPGLISVSTAVWISLAIALGAFVAVRYQKHIETPDSMHLT